MDGYLYQRKIFQNLAMIKGKFKNRSCFLLNLAFFCFFIGCSNSVNSLEITSENENDPFQLVIDNEVFDGKKLYLLSHIKTTSFASDVPEHVPVVVRLRTVADGKEIGEAFFPTKTPVDDGLIRLSADAKGFTDYQAELLWGSEASAFLSKVPPSEFIEIKEVTLSQPSEEGLQRVQGIIQNNGGVQIENLSVVLQLAWVKDQEYIDLSTLSEENSTHIKIPDIHIPAGEKKPFSIELTKSLPVQSGGSWLAVVRVDN